MEDKLYTSVIRGLYETVPFGKQYTWYETIVKSCAADCLLLLDAPDVEGWINDYIRDGLYTKTCLFAACEFGNLDVLGKILNIQGVNFHEGLYCLGVCINTPLSVAVDSNRLDIVKLLVTYGVELQKNFMQVTPLHIAARDGRLEILEFLVNLFSDDINVKTTHAWWTCPAPLGSTPLHIAAISGNFKAVKLLVESGADISCTAADKTASDLALDKQHEDIYEYLKCKEKKEHFIQYQRSRTTKLEARCEELESKFVDLESKYNKLLTEKNDLRARIEKKNGNGNRNNKGHSKALCVKKNLIYLTENLYPDDHIDFLLQESVISTENYQVIRCKEGYIRQSREMLLILLRKKTTDWAEVFYQSLEKNCKHLLHIFDSDK